MARPKIDWKRGGVLGAMVSVVALVVVFQNCNSTGSPFAIDKQSAAATNPAPTPSPPIVTTPPPTPAPLPSPTLSPSPSPTAPALCSVGEYHFCRITSQNGSVYTCDVSYYLSDTLIVGVASVGADGSFTGYLAWAGSDVPRPMSGSCANGNWTVTGPTYGAAGTVSASGSYGISADYTVIWNQSGVSGTYPGNGTSLSVTSAVWGLSNAPFIGAAGVPY